MSPRESKFSFDDPLRYVTEFATTIPNTSPSMRLTTSPAGLLR